MSKFFEDFKKFAFKGNVIDMAVGVVIGSAFGKIVTSIVNDLIMPIFGAITAGAQFSSLKLVLSPAVLNEAGEVVKAEAAITYGNLIQNVVDFLLIAFSIFVFVRFVNKVSEKMKKEEAAPAPEEPKGPTQEELLAEIRDLLKAQK
ncbi:MAG: large-conductance mechanosensitive channel protein MscL [Negativibacillus sp.]